MMWQTNNVEKGGYLIGASILRYEGSGYSDREVCGALKFLASQKLLGSGVSLVVSFEQFIH